MIQVRLPDRQHRDVVGERRPEQPIDAVHEFLRRHVARGQPREHGHLVLAVAGDEVEQAVAEAHQVVAGLEVHGSEVPAEGVGDAQREVLRGQPFRPPLGAQDDGEAVPGVHVVDAAAGRVGPPDEGGDEGAGGAEVLQHRVVHRADDVGHVALPVAGVEAAERQRAELGAQHSPHGRHQDRGADALAHHVGHDEGMAIIEAEVVEEVAGDGGGRSAQGGCGVTGQVGRLLRQQSRLHGPGPAHLAGGRQLGLDPGGELGGDDAGVVVEPARREVVEAQRADGRALLVAHREAGVEAQVRRAGHAGQAREARVEPGVLDHGDATGGHGDVAEGLRARELGEIETDARLEPRTVLVEQRDGGDRHAEDGARQLRDPVEALLPTGVEDVERLDRSLATALDLGGSEEQLGRLGRTRP